MTYQRGDRIVLVHTTDPHTRLVPGTAGTVTGYDHRHRQLAVAWDDGSTLAMLLDDGDQVRLLNPSPAGQHARPGRRQAGQARLIGRRQGKAAVHWQIGDSSSGEAREFWQTLLRGIASRDPHIMDLYEIPALTGQQDYDLASLAADLGLARDDPALPSAADTYRAAACKEFWAEASRLARHHLHPGEAGDVPQDITDPATGLSRLLARRCSTCILRPGDKMHLGPQHTAAFVRQALAEGTYVVCHQTLTYGDNPHFGPAICRGFFDAYAGRSPALRLLEAFSRLTEVEPPQPQADAR